MYTEMCYKCNNIISCRPTQNAAVQTGTISTQIARNTEVVAEGMERVRLVCSDWRVAVAEWELLGVEVSGGRENNALRNRRETGRLAGIRKMSEESKKGERKENKKGEGKQEARK